MLKHLKASVTVGALICVTGCVSSPDVVFVDTNSDIVRLGRDVSGHVFYRDGSGRWVRSANKVKLPAGWYAGGMGKEILPVPPPD